jgi:beta-glucosidase
MFAFGHGLSYTSFSYGDLSVTGGDTIGATFMVSNTGKVAGADVPQLYLTAAPGEKRMRLLGFERVELAPGESRKVTLAADPRLLARYDGKANRWRIAEGVHEIALGKSAGDLALIGSASLTGRDFVK